MTEKETRITHIAYCNHARAIVLICENCGERHTVPDWLPLGGYWHSGDVRGFCSEKCKREWWVKVPVFEMGGGECTTNSTRGWQGK